MTRLLIAYHDGMAIPAAGKSKRETQRWGVVEKESLTPRQLRSRWINSPEDRYWS
jgi:hypothetical protein